MYGIPEGIDWSFAVGKELLMVCIGRHQVILRLQGEVTITIESSFEHISANAGAKGTGELAQTAASLISVVGTTVEAIRAEDARTLWLCFSNGDALRIYDSNTNYEAFQITAPGVHIVV